MRKFGYLAGGSVLAMAMSLSVGAAAAQEREGETASVDALIVTANKREQNLQDVPVVVTVVSAQQIQDAGVRDIKDLTVLTPGLIVTSTSNETVTTARIRGVGTVGDNPGLESSVGVVIDGIYRPRNGVGFGDLGEMDRIEVLKGPQGTLFGKNTSAGVINIMTKQPDFTLGAQGELTVGNYNARGVSGSLNVPIVEDVVAGRLFFARRERDGFYDTNVAGPRTDREDNNQDFWTVRGQILAVPNEDLTIRLIADYTKREEICCLAVNVIRGATQAAADALVAGGATTNPPNPGARVTNANRPTDQNITDRGVSAEINWDTPWLGGAELTSITGARRWTTENGQDSDFTRADLLYRDPDGGFGRDFKQFSQEFRLAGETDRVNWLVGAFYANEKLVSKERLLIGTQLEQYLDLVFTSGANPAGLETFTGLPAGAAFIAGRGPNDTYDQDSRSFALFTNNSIKFTEALELTVGLRWTKEKKELDAHYTNLGANPGCGALLTREAVNAAILGGGNAAAGRATTSYALLYGYGCSAGFTPAFANVTTRQEASEEEFSGTAKLTYRWNSDVMTYGSYARGYKAGGFNLDRARTGSTVAGFGVQPNTSFPGEFVDSYELGAKTTWFNRSLLLNASVFHQKFTDFQLNTFTGISFIVASIPEVTSKGVDTDLIWFTPVDGLTLQGGVTYAETTYGKFTPGPGVSARLPGAQLSFAPEWSSSASVSYETDLTENLTFRVSANAKYTSEYNTGSDLAPLKLQEALTLVNARVGIGSQDERWAVELWGQNLTDELYKQVAFDGTFQAGAINAFLGAPRTYGMTLRSKF